MQNRSYTSKMYYVHDQSIPTAHKALLEYVEDKGFSKSCVRLFHKKNDDFNALFVIGNRFIIQYYDDDMPFTNITVTYSMYECDTKIPKLVSYKKLEALIAEATDAATYVEGLQTPMDAFDTVVRMATEQDIEDTSDLTSIACRALHETEGGHYMRAVDDFVRCGLTTYQDVLSIINAGAEKLFLKSAMTSKHARSIT